MTNIPDMALLCELRAAGLQVTPQPDGRVSVSPRTKLTATLRGRILDCKPELLAALDLERRIREMAKRWNYSHDDLAETLEAASHDPAVWLMAVHADESLADKLERAGMPFLAGG